MDNIPPGSRILLVVVTLAVVVGTALIIAWLLAGARRPEIEDDPVGDTSLALRPPGALRADRLATAAAALSGLFFLLAAGLPWGSVDLTADAAGIAWGSRAWDDSAGLVATVGSSALMAVVVILGIRPATMSRAAIVAAVVGAGWLIVTLDGLIVMSATNSTSDSVVGLVGDRAGAHLRASGALWFAMAGAVLSILGATVRGFVHHPEALASAPAGGLDYGDGF